jgi:carboxypeptidase Taq
VTLTVAGAAYQELEARFHRLQALREAQGVLGWDQRTMMPPGGAEARGEHIATLRSINHGMLTAPEIGDLLDAAENDNALGDWQRANLCEIRRQWTRATCLPEK